MGLQRHAVIVGVALLASWWTWQTRHYAPVFASGWTLAQHVVAHAPEKPRALLNYGAFLAVQGRLDEAERVFDATERAVTAPHVPRFDRVETLRDLAGNRQALAQVRRWIVGRISSS